MTRFALLLLILAFAATSLFAEPPQIRWERHYAYDTADYEASAVCATRDGGFVMAGTCRLEYITRGVFLIRTNANGDSLWTFSWSENGLYNPVYIHERADGKIVAISNSGLNAMAVLTVSASGIFEELCTIPGDSMSPIIWATSAIATSDGGYVIAGEIPVPCMTTDLRIIRTDGDGNEIWRLAHNYGSNTDEYIRGIEETGDRDFIMFGSINDYNIGFRGVEILRVGSAGNLLWSGAVLTGNYSSINASARFACGDYMVAGQIDTNGTCLIRFDSSGNSLGSCSFGGIGRLLQAGWVKEVSGGDHVWIGSAYMSQDTLPTIVIGRCTSSGQLRWTGLYPRLARNYPRVYALQTDDGGYLIFGTALDPNDPQHTIPYALRTDPDYTAVTESPAVPRSSEMVVYPNPFNARAEIRFRLEHAASVNLTLFDELGREMQTLVNSKLSAGEHRVAIDGSKLAAGIYFARLECDAQGTVRKLLLLK